MNVPLDAEDEMLHGDAGRDAQNLDEEKSYMLTTKSMRPTSYTEYDPNYQGANAQTSVTSQMFGQLDNILEKIFKVLEIVLFLIIEVADVLQLIRQKSYSLLLYYVVCVLGNVPVICAICGVKAILETAQTMFQFVVNDYGIEFVILLELLTADINFDDPLSTVASLMFIMCWCCLCALLIIMTVAKCRHSTAFSSAGPP